MTNEPGKDCLCIAQCWCSVPDMHRVLTSYLLKLAEPVCTDTVQLAAKSLIPTGGGSETVKESG